MDKGGRAQRWLRITLAFSMTFIGIVIAPLAPTPTATAVDAIDNLETYGIWSNILGEDDPPVAPPCLVEVPNPQQANPATLNTVRFGLPADAGGGCGSSSDRSGFGFQGRVITQAITSDDVFALGTFTHFNNPISANDDNVGTGTLTATIEFTNPLSGLTEDIEVVWDVTLDETPNAANPCAYPDVPPGINGNGCADRVTFDQNVLTESVQVGETTLTFDIAGFGTIGQTCTDVTGGTLPTPGSAVTTAEGGQQTACMYGQVKPGTLVIVKDVVGGGADDDVEFTIQERTQIDDDDLDVGDAIGDPIVVDVDVDANGDGSQSIEVEAGVYSITESSLPAGVAFNDLECVSTSGDPDNKAYSTQNVPGDAPETRIDLDSGETITCTYTNEKEATIRVAKDVANDDGGVFDFDTTSPAGTPVFGALPATIDDLGDGETRVFTVDKGSYSITEVIPSGYRFDGVSCVETGTQNVVGVPGGTGVSLTVDPGDDVTCTFTNYSRASIQLAKYWNPGQVGDEATLTADVGNGGPVELTFVSASPGGTFLDIDTNTVEFDIGAPIALEETLDDASAYMSGLSCAGGGSLSDTLPDDGRTGLPGLLATTDLAPGATVLCTFDNQRRMANLELVKELVPATDTGRFDLIAESGNPRVEIDREEAQPGAAVTPISVLVGQQIFLSEEPANGTKLDNYVRTVECEYSGGIIVVDPDDFVVPVGAAGETITCTFKNERKFVDVEVRKVWSGDSDGSSTTITTAGTSPNTLNQPVQAGAPYTSSDVLRVPVGGSFTVSETGLDNYKESLLCTGPGIDVSTSGDPGAAGSLSETIAIPSDTADGADVVCTFTNTRKTVDVVVAKQLAPAEDTGRFDLQIDGNTVVDEAGNGDSNAATPVVVNVGDEFEVAELDGESTDLANYDSSLACPVATELTNTDTAGSFRVPGTADDGSTVLCTFTNSRGVATVTVVKEWAGDTSDGSSTTITTSGADDDIKDNEGVVVAGAPFSQTLTIPVGASFSARETGLDNYSEAYDCTYAGSTQLPSDASDVAADLPFGPSFVVPADADAGDNKITCTFTNTRKSAELLLEKVWVNANAGDAVTITGDRADGLPDASYAATADGVAPAVVNQTDTQTTGVTVWAGEVIDFSEQFAPPGSAANYATPTFECTGADAATDGSLTVAAVDTDADAQTDNSITCTYTNTRLQTTLVVEKIWVDAHPGDEVEVTATGIANPVTLQSTVGGTAPAAIDQTDTSNTVVVYAGETFQLGETFEAGNAAWYAAPVWSCTGTALDQNTLTASVGTTPIECDVTNTRNSATLTVQKDWNDPVGGPSVTLAVTGGADSLDGTTVSTSNTDLVGAAAPTMTVYSGEELDVTETFADAATAGYFTSGLDCATPQSIGAAVKGDLTIAADPVDIVCTFTNTRKTATLDVDKRWINGLTDDTANVTISGAGGAPTLGASTVADEAGLFDEEVASRTVYVGDTVTVTETLAPAAAGNRYDSTYSCRGATATPGRSTTVDILASDAGTTITCEFENDRRGVNVVVTKDWHDSPENGDTVQLSIAGGQLPPSVTAPAAVNSNDGVDNDADAVSRGLVGETLTLGEAFTVGQAVNYDISFECRDAQDALVTAEVNWTLGAQSAELEITSALAGRAEPITCAFTNDRKRTSFELRKSWIASVEDDSVELNIDSTSNAAPVDAFAPGGDGDSTEKVTTTVYAGEQIVVSELIDPDAGTPNENTAVYDPTDFSCTGTTDGVVAIDGLSSTITVTANEVANANTNGVPIFCEFENTAQRGTVVIAKLIEGQNDGTFQFTSTLPTDGLTADPVGAAAPAFSIETDQKSGTVTFTDVLVPKDGGTYSVTELNPSPAFDGTRVECTGQDPAGRNGDGALIGTIALTDDGPVTCVFTNTERSSIIIVKDADPDSAADFDFTGELGPFTLDDDGTLPDPSDTSNTKLFDFLNAEAGSTYTITETPTAGWTLDLDRSNCDNGAVFSGNGVTVDPDPGTTVTCTFVNEADPVGLSATKKVSGVIGEWGPFSFTLEGQAPNATFTGDGTQPVDNLASTPLVDETADWADLVEGQQYLLTEDFEPGYVPNVDFTCQVKLPGQDLFESLPDENSASPGFLLTAVAGATYSCEITNTAVPPTLVVEKTTVGDVGTFTFDVTPTTGGDAVAPIEVTTVAGDTPVSSTPVDLQAGIGYTIAEQTSDAWVEGTLECDVTNALDVTTEYVFDTITKPGDEISCEITNTKRSRIIIEKTTVPAAAIGSFGFEATWDDEVADPADFFLADGESHDSGYVDPGMMYTVTELDATGFDLTAIDCSSSLVGAEPDAFESVENSNVIITTVPGETVTCEFTNNQVGEVTVDKVANPDSIERVGTTYTVVYDLTVRNSSFVPETFDLTDTPDFADNVTITSVLATGPGIADPGLELGATGGIIVDDGTIPARAGFGAVPLQYTVTVTFTMVPPAEGQVQECADIPTADQGAFNSATVTFRGGSDDGSDCVDLPLPQITVDKAPDTGAVATQVGDGFQYQAVYTVTVENVGEGPGSYTVADLPAFPTGVTVDSVTFDPVPDPTSNVIEPDGEDVYTVTVLFTVPGDLPIEDRECADVPTPGQGGYNGATVTYGGGTPSDTGCIDIPEPDIQVTKAPDEGVEATQVGDGFQYQAVYTVTVDNFGDGPGAYTVADLPAFPAGVTVDSVTFSPEPDAVSNPIAGGGQDVYTVTVLFTVPGDLPIEDRECADDPTAGQGGYNGATVTFDGGTDADTGCIDIPLPDIEVTKGPDGGVEATPVADQPFTYDAVYTVTVDNNGDGPGVYTIDDLPAFPSGADVVVDGVTFSPEPNAVANPIAAGGQDVYTVTVRFTVDGDLASADRECGQEPTEGQGGYNTALVTFDGGTDSDWGCIDIPNPNIDYSKVVVGDAAVFNGDNQWTVTYRIDVTNLDPADGVAGPGQYDLTDTFDFGPGVTVTDVEVTPTPVSDPFTGAAPDNVLADDEPIGRNQTHSYSVVVDVTIVPTAGTIANCNVEGGGLRNVAGLSVSTEGEPRDDEEACADFATLTLVKVISDDDDGGNATETDFLLSATNGDIASISGTTPVRASVPPGTYVLDEDGPAGYTSPGYVCEGAEPGYSVDVGTGEDIVCVITNDDEPVDLELVKDDDVEFAVAGGDPFEYTISVRNIGSRDVDTGENAIVTDVLPEPLEWETWPANCDAPVGQTLTCTIPAAQLPAGGEWVVISTTVSAPADTPADTYVNEAYVTTADDPVCQPVGDCEPPPCEEADGNNNVDCEETPVDREAELDIVKEDDVTGSVVNGETYSYDLSVTNLGPSTVYNVVVTDDLPAGLTLVDLAYDDEDWSCNDADPIACDYLPALQPGATAAGITVTVQVGATAIFADDTIVNTAVVNGTLDEEGEDPVDPADSTEETPLERTIEIEVLTVDCLQDAPFVFYDITPLGFVPDGPVTFRLYDVDDNLVATLVRNELSGRFVYPGAAVDSDGNGIDWPGWAFEDGTWVLDDSDAILREGLRITVEINPTGEVDVEYPPASAACADPTQTSADLSIEKSASATQLAIPLDGSAIEFDWILDVTNDGPDPGVNVVVSDVVPDDLTITGVASSDFSCSTSGQTVTCTRAELAVGGTGSITISVETDEANNYENVATVENSVPDPDLTNNFDDATVNIVASQPPVTQAPPPVTLPPTGSDSTSPVLRTALMLLAIGALGLLAARRRRTGIVD